MLDENTVVTEEAVEEEAVETPEAKGSDETKQQEYAKTQQQLDQERANARKARQQAAEAQQRADAMAEQLQGVQSQMNEIKEQLKQQLTTKEMSDVLNLDPNTTDVPELVTALQKHAARMKNLEDKAEQYDQFVAQQKQRAAQTAQQEQHEKAVEEIYGMCDDEYGAECRNEAIALADKLVVDGEAEKPQTQFQGLRLMQRCYKQVAEAKKRAKPASDKKTVATDTGLRDVSHLQLEDSEDYKPGPLRSVRADMEKKMRAGKWKAAFAGPSSP